MVHVHMSYKDFIESRPEILLGKPVIKGTRISVDLILRKLSEGATIENLMESYEGMKREELLACLEYSADVIASEAFLEA